MRIRLPWKRGPAAPDGTVFVSATRFEYSRLRDMPVVAVFAQWLRWAWDARPGAVGLFVAAEPHRRVTYSLSVWKSEEDLRRFLRSPEHVKVVRAYKRRLDETRSVSWQTDHFDPDRLWREGLERLTSTPAPRPRAGRASARSPAA
jgi:hypothetical protein